MKKLLILLLVPIGLIICGFGFRATPGLQMNVVGVDSAIPAQTYLLSEDFTTGLPTDWGYSGTTNWTDTNAVGYTGAMEITLGTYTSKVFTASSQLWAYFVWRCSGSRPGGSRDLIAFQTNNVTQFAVAMNPTLGIVIMPSNLSSTNFINSGANTNYHIWIQVTTNAVTGRGEMYAYYAENSALRPASPQASFTNNASIASINRIRGNWNASGTFAWWDKIRISTNEIGSNPE